MWTPDTGVRGFCFWNESWEIRAEHPKTHVQKAERGAPGIRVLMTAGYLRFRWRANYSARARWTNETEIEPSPTAEATRLTLPQRTSPTANTPGSEVSSRWGERSSGHPAAARSSLVRSHPVLMKPFASSATRPFSQAVLALAPVIRNTCLRS